MTSNNISVSWYGSNVSCYAEAVNESVLWGTKRPLFEPLPVLFRQMALVVGSNLLFFFILKRYNQPRIICDLISALVVSPFILEMLNKELSRYVWPSNGNSNLSVLANLGILYCMFMKGLQMDLGPLTQRQGAKTLYLSFGIFLIPFAIGCALYEVFCKEVFSRDRGKAVFVYWGAILASSSSQTLAAILAKLKLLSTDIGRESLCICMINDIVSWVLMVVVIALSSMPHTKQLEASSWNPVMVVLSFTVLFGLFCYLVIRPCVNYFMIKHYKDEENYDNSVVHFMLVFVMVCGLVSEFFGAYAFLGAFFFGLVIPHGALSQSLEEKMDSCMSRLLLPLYFASIGVKMKRIDGSVWLRNIDIALVATVLKPLCVYLFSIMCSMPHSDAFALAVLQNPKGIPSVAVAVIGFDRLHLRKEALSVLILIIILSTVIVGPIMSICYKRVRKNTNPYQHKSVGVLKPYDDFRVVACIQETQNLPGILTLLEINNSDQSPMSVFGVHLTELIGKASAMLIVHQASGDDAFANDNPFFSKKNAQSNQIVSAFDSFRKKHMRITTVQTLSVLSPMDSMHEDIFNIVEDKQVSMIMLPYHKRKGMDGNLEDCTNVEFRTVNQNVMRTSPCSVGLFIDRSGRTLSSFQTGGSTRKGSGSGSDRFSIGEVRTAMLYFGGPDDREALAFSTRLARHPLVTLTLIHFVAGDDPSSVEPMASFGEEEEDSGVQAIDIESEAERMIDNDFIHQCLNQRQIERPIEYWEMRSNNGEETIAKLRGMDHKRFDLYVVGRGEKVYSPMTAGLAEWSEDPELGVVGEVLVTSDVVIDVSVFVVQQSLDARRVSSRSSGSAGSSLLDSGASIRF